MRVFVSVRMVVMMVIVVVFVRVMRHLEILSPDFLYPRLPPILHDGQNLRNANPAACEPCRRGNPNLLQMLK